MLNDDQQSAIANCARHGHKWGPRPDERCRCCSWPRKGVSVRAGGYLDAPHGQLRDMWPMDNVLLRLADAVDILLDDFSYDGHGHEELREASWAARAHAGALYATRDALQADVSRADRFKQIVQLFLDHYPEDVFPPDGTSTDCKSAKFARTLLRGVLDEFDKAVSSEAAPAEARSASDLP